MSELGRGLRDTAIALGLVAAVLGVLWLWTGVWPPMVVVESGSMMHPNEDVPYGRLGTIDPGDLVLVQSIDGRSDVALWADDGEGRYGSSGDVLVYYPSNDRTRTPVIHRAIAWVEVTGQGTGRTYTFSWPYPEDNCRGGVCVFDARGIYFPELGFGSAQNFKPTDGWKPPASGWITKGDNPRTNAAADQATGISCPLPGRAPQPRPTCEAVDPSWVEGRARGELPWFGLIKLAVGGRPNMEKQGADWMTLGWATAPRDLWVMLAVSLAVLIAAPVALDAVKSRRKGA